MASTSIPMDPTVRLDHAIMRLELACDNGQVARIVKTRVLATLELDPELVQHRFDVFITGLLEVLAKE